MKTHLLYDHGTSAAEVDTATARPRAQTIGFASFVVCGGLLCAVALARAFSAPRAVLLHTTDLDTFASTSGVSHAHAVLLGARFRVLPSTREQFYERALGMRPQQGSPLRYSYLEQDGGQFIELLEAQSPTTPPAVDVLGATPPCFWCGGILVGDVVNAANALRLDDVTSHLNFSLTSREDTNQFRDVGTMCEVVDNSGIQTELLQRTFGAARPVDHPSLRYFEGATYQSVTYRTADRALTLKFWQALGFRFVLDQHVAPDGFALMFLVSPDARFRLNGFDEGSVEYTPGPGSNNGGPSDGDSGFTGNSDGVSIHLQEQHFMMLQIQYFMPTSNVQVQPYRPPPPGEAGWLGFVLGTSNVAALLAQARMADPSFVSDAGSLVEPNGVPLLLEAVSQ